MKTKKFLAIAALAAGFVSCSSEDEFVSNSDTQAGKEIALNYAAGKAVTRANSDIADKYCGTTYDFAGTEKKLIDVFFVEDATATEDKQNYKSTAYAYEAYQKTLKRTDTDIPYWSYRATPTIQCIALYPAGLVGDGWLTSNGNTGADFFAVQKKVKELITANGPKYDFTQVDFSSNGVKLIGVPLDQSTEENYAKADILVGVPNGNTDFTTFSLTPDKEGTLKFRHAGTKITLFLKSGANTVDTDLQGAKVTAINFPTVGVINPITYTGEGGFFNYVWWNEVVKNEADQTEANKHKDNYGQADYDSGNHGSEIIMTTNLGSTLKCSCLIPTFSMHKAPGFVIELSNGTKAIWHRGSSATSVDYKNLVGKEAIFTLTINSRAEVKETAYTVTDWTTYEESANVDVQ